MAFDVVGAVTYPFRNPREFINRCASGIYHTPGKVEDLLADQASAVRIARAEPAPTRNIETAGLVLGGMLVAPTVIEAVSKASRKPAPSREASFTAELQAAEQLAAQQQGTADVQR